MQTNSNYRLPPRVVEALRPYAQRRKGKWPVSIAAMVRATRYAVPTLPVTDEILAELIA